MIHVTGTLLLAAVEAVAMQPSGKWRLEYAENACVLTRPYRDGAAEAGISIVELPLSDTLVLTIGAPGKGTTERFSVDVFTGAKTATGYASRGKLGLAGFEATRVQIDDLVVDDLPDKGDITLVGAKRNPEHIVIAIDGMATVKKGLRSCQADLLRTWGADPAILAEVAIPAEPIGEKQSWITANDYPAAAIRKEEQGDVVILFRVEVDGQVRQCGVKVSSGSKDLDAVGCRAMIQRARYIPARDAKGDAVASYVVRRTAFRLPD